MKILIDDNVCQGHGRCYRVAKWLNYDDEGYVVPRGEEIEVPAGDSTSQGSGSGVIWCGTAILAVTVHGRDARGTSK